MLKIVKDLIKYLITDSDGDSGETGETPAKKSKRKSSKVPTRVGI